MNKEYQMQQENNSQSTGEEQNKQQPEPPQKTQEELEWEEQLKKRLDELRKRDPFIYR